MIESAPRASSPGSMKAPALWMASLSGFLTPFMGSAVNIALPAIASRFRLSAVTLGWVSMSYQLAAAIFLVPFGRLADILGRKKIFAGGVAVFTAGSALSALAPTAPLLIAFRVVQAIGGAMMFGTGVAILTSVFPPGERGKALGISTAATYLGLSLGPVAGGFLTQSLGWRSIFWTIVPLGLATLAISLRGLRGEWADARGEAFDLAGALLFGTGLAGLMYGFSKLPSPPAIALTAAGSALLALFVVRENRAARPLLGVRLFRENRIYAFSNLAALINYSATSAVAFLLSLYLQYIKGMPPRAAGLVLIAQPVLMAVFSPWAGRLSDRKEPRLVASLGMALATAGLLLFSFLGDGTPMGIIVAGLAFLGLGFGLFSSPNTHAVMGAVDRRNLGLASATLGTMRLTGQMLSMGFSVLVIALVMGNVRIAPATFPAFLRSARTAFVFYSALCAVGVAASLARGRKRAAVGAA